MSPYRMTLAAACFFIFQNRFFLTAHILDARFFRAARMGP